MRDKNVAVFIDRDGTINEEAGYINHIDRFKLLPNTAAAIHLLNLNNIKAVVVTNQAGVARGYFQECLIKDVHNRLIETLKKDSAYIDGIYYCPHHPEAGSDKYRKRCRCRKPNTGMLEMAADDISIDISRSYVVGDKISDVQMAHTAGAKGIMVLTGYGKGELELHGSVKPDYIGNDLLKAVEWILEDLKKA